MASYQLTNGTAIIRESDNAWIPADPMNTDYQVYQAWVTAGNTPDAASDNSSIILIGQAQAALVASDMVAIRCYKAAVAFPSEWQTYVTSLRAIVNSGTGTLPTQPDYPEGT